MIFLFNVQLRNKYDDDDDTLYPLPTFPPLFFHSLPPLVHLGGLGSALSCQQGPGPAASAFLTILTPENRSGDSNISVILYV